MKKQVLPLLAFLTASLFLLISSCDKKDDAPAKTKTQLVTQSSWIFQSAFWGSTDVSNQDPPFKTCRKDNIITFTSAGGGTVTEGAIACSPPEPITFTWSFTNGETILHVNTPLYPGTGNDFTVISISETLLVLQASYTPTVGPTILINITFHH
ncbi:MAG: lipocalin family protein [Chitinophagaceae bacterium]